MSAPTTASLPTDLELSQALRLIDDRIEAGADPRPLRALRERLAAEMVGDAGAVGATLAEDFELVTRTGSASHTARRADVLKNLGRMAAVGSVMWIELEDLVSDASTVAAHGGMRMLVPQGDGVLLSSTPIALFLRFEGALMTSETIYFDAAAGATTTLPGEAMPTQSRLRALLDPTGRPS